MTKKFVRVTNRIDANIGNSHSTGVTSGALVTHGADGQTLRSANSSARGTLKVCWCGRTLQPDCQAHAGVLVVLGVATVRFVAATTNLNAFEQFEIEATLA